MKTPSKGPEVAEANVIEVSIIPEKNPIVKLIPITRSPHTTLTIFII